ncbi:MAG TPA: autotransporter-associated beta strand repeat-containing protein, partial [Rhizomicrobium sp.]|nr:autotransporter-associated beta strand repeat-containing protein [Rhizomicrobium sp.]
MAATDTWGGSSSVNWSDAGNWSPGVPGANDTVVINQSGANAPSNYDISQTFQSVTFDTGATITNAGTNTFGIASGGFITDNASTAVVFDSSTPVTLNGAATINVASGASLTFGGGLTGTGPVTVNNGGGSLIFLGASNYTGGTNINAGSLQLGNGTSDGTIGGNVSLNGTSTSLIFDENSNSVVYSNTISGTGGVTQEGGLVTFTGTQTYSGLTSIVGGSTLQLGDGVANNGMISGDAAVASGATLAFDEPNTATYAGNITGGGQVTISGPGTVIFTGAGNNYGGGTTINGTTLQIGTDALQGSISASGGIALSGGTIDFHNLTQSTFDYGGVISGAGNVAIDNNTVVYTNVDSYLGTTTIGSNGTLQLGVAGGAVGGINQAGAIVDNGKVVFQNVGASAEIDGGITGTGSVTVALGSATDTVILTGTNSYASGSPTTKDTTITTGVLQIGNFTSSLTGSLAGNVSIGSAGTLDFNDIDPANNTFSGVISGNGTLEVDNGTLILTNSGNVISTADIGTNGTLQIGNGLLNTVGGTNYVGSLFGTTINDNGTLAFEPPAATTFVITQGISGSGVLTQNGPGTTILTGNDALTGGATVVAGTLEFGSGAQFTGSGTFGVDSGATLAFGNTSSFTFGSQITGAGNVSVVGSAPVILTNSDDYSGTTTINAGGTLQVGNSTTAGAITGTSG